MSDLVDRDEDRERSPLHERDSLGMFETVAAGESRDKFRPRVRKSGVSGLSKGPLVSVVYFARDKTASTESRSIKGPFFRLHRVSFMIVVLS